MPNHDPFSVNGTTLPLQEQAELLVIGAGHAGLAAAIAAAEAGTKVVLVDENPVPPETMGDDIPLHFGNRISPAARNRNAMTEAFLAADPNIERAFDLGVDIRLGTACHGLYANGPSVGWLPGPVAALADTTHAWLLGAKRIIVATGRRDIGLAFDNWTLPGVMGMEAALRLARCGSLETRRAIVLGTTTEALTGAETLAAAGIEIAALVEPGPTPQDQTQTTLPILTQHTIRRAEPGPNGVAAATLATPQGERTIPCDTIILAIGTVPLVELLDSATCRTAWDPARGGPAPILGPAGQTTIPNIAAAGDCAGIWPAKSRNPAIAANEGRQAALQTAQTPTQPPSPTPGPTPGPTPDIDAYRALWVRTALLEARTEPHVCQCEEVTAREIIELRPPRYLAAPTDRRNTRDLLSLLGNAPSPDQVKRLTRAGMGLCQGRRCREQVATLMALATGTPLAEIPLATHRAPVRPLPLNLTAGTPEDPRITQHWDVWFGMKSQYRAFWDLPTHHTAATREQGPRGSE